MKPNIFTKNDNEINRHSEDMQDIITAVPPQLITWGICVFFFVLLLVMFISATIPYPDSIKVPLKIRSATVEKAVVSKVPGIISKILVQQGQMVYNGQQLIWLQNSLSHQSINDLESRLRLLSYDLMRNKPVNQVLTSIDTANTGNFKMELTELLSKFKQKKYTRTVKSKRRSYADTQTRHSIYNILNKIEIWKKEYIVYSSNSGRVSYTGILHNGQNVNVNQTLFFIIPDGQLFYGEIPITQANIGNVRLGQKVIIKLAAFPYQDFGVLDGRITFISDNPNNSNNFIAEVDLQNQLHTFGNQKITLKDGLSAEAEIITRNTTIWRRLFKNAGIFNNETHNSAN